MQQTFDSIIHIYPRNCAVHGGIESQIKDACDVAQKSGTSSQWLDEKEFLKFTFQKRAELATSLVMIHGVLPKTIAVFFFGILFCNIRRRSLWMPHFHPPEFTKRPVMVGLYMTAVRLLFAFVKRVKIVVYSKSQKEAFGRYLGKHDITVLPFGLREKKFETEQGFLDKRAQVTPRYDAIYICRSDKIKHRDLYVALAERYSDQKFCLVTDGPVAPVDNLDVFFSVPHEQLVDLLLHSRFFVSTSIYESYGLAIAEAEFHGMPALVRRQTGYFDQFERNEFPQNGASLVFDEDEDLFVKWEGLSEIGDDVLFDKKVISHFHARALRSSFEKTMSDVVALAAKQ